jgi:ABC-type Zn uptake system ZnuABC Zn-binding protein ZnuA
MTDSRHDPGGYPSEPLNDVLERVSEELIDVAVLIERLEPLLSNGRSTEFLASPDHMRVMQGIDLAVQKARGLAEFLEGIGGRLEPDQLVDISTALNLITLEDMKRRLRASIHEAPSAEIYQKASGDLDFF